MKKVNDMQAMTTREMPIGISWGRVGRQVLAFLMAVAGIVMLFEYLRTFAR
jgi:hypothetical protein